MQGILIDTDLGFEAVTTVEVDGPDPIRAHRSITGYVGCSFIERIDLGEDLDAWLDEEPNMTEETQQNIIATKLAERMLGADVRALYGRCLLLGRTGTEVAGLSDAARDVLLDALSEIRETIA